METACLLFAILVGAGIAVAALLNIFMMFVQAGILAEIMLILTGGAIAACGVLVMKGKL